MKPKEHELTCMRCGEKYKVLFVTERTQLCPSCSMGKAKARAKLHGMIFK